MIEDEWMNELTHHSKSEGGGSKIMSDFYIRKLLHVCFLTCIYDETAAENAKSEGYSNHKYRNNDEKWKLSIEKKHIYILVTINRSNKIKKPQVYLEILIGFQWQNKMQLSVESKYKWKKKD